MSHPNSRSNPPSAERALIDAARRQASALATAGADNSPTDERCDCPSLDTLTALEAGRLGEAEAETIRQHLQSCEACQVFVGADNRVASAAETISSDGGVTMSPMASPPPPNAPPPAAPRQLGQYEIREVLGRGGMGAVYKARHARLDKFVAIKILPEERLEDPAAVERFEREMRAVGKLDHPNIASAHDAGEFEGTHFLVIEYVDGVDLSALSRKLGPLPVAESCELIRQAALGLQHAHGRGLVHRDVKPSNLLLARSGESRPLLKVLDFGLALLEEQAVPGERDLTTATQFMGTWDYVAPEQALDTHHVDARADIYSLGATLYKLLTGVTPFPREQYSTPLQAMMAKTGANAPSICTVRELPEELGQCIDRMLKRSPNNRPATAEEIAQTLAPFARVADLTALLQRYDEAENPARNEVRVPPGQGRIGSDEATADFMPQAAAAQPQPSAVRRGNRRRVMTLAALVGLLLLCGVVLIVRDRDGKEKLRVQLEPGDGLELAGQEGEQRQGRQTPPTTSPRASAHVKRSGPALAFDGQDDYARFDGLRLPAGAYTIETWAYYDNDVSNEADGRVIQIPGDAARAKLDWQSHDNRQFLTFTHVTGTSDPWRIARKFFAPDELRGRFVHLACTWDGRSAELFVDGVHVQKDPRVSSRDLNAETSVPAVIGALPVFDQGIFVNPFHGKLAELRVSNVVRYEKDFTPTARFEPDEHTLALCHFDEGSGDVLHDCSGNGHHGTIVGAKWVIDKPTKFSFPPLEEAWLAGLAKLSSDDRRAEVVAELQRRNPHAGAIYQRPDFALEIAPSRGALDLTPLSADYDELWINGKSPDEHAIVDGEHLRASSLVNLYFNNVTVENLSALAGMPFQGVWMNGAPIDDVSVFGQMPSLTRLSLCGTKIENLTPLAGLSLTRLEIQDTRVADLSPLRGMPLTLLVCGKTQISDISPLEGMPLVHLNLWDLQLEDLRPLSSLEHLDYLDLAHVRTEDAQFSNLEKLSKLRKLVLHHATISDAGLASVGKLRSLEELNVSSTTVTEQGLPHLASLTNLHSLWLDFTAITDAGMEHLAQLKGLRTLGLSKSKVTAQGLGQLASLELEHLSLDDVSLDAAALIPLKRFKKLKTLSIKNTRLSTEAVASLQEALPETEILYDGPLLLKPMSPAALVSEPAAIEGLQSWTLETPYPRDQIYVCRFNHDGSLLATGGDDAMVRIWNTEDRSLHAILVGHDCPIISLDWSQDGAALLSSGGNEICIWDPHRGRLVKQWTTSELPLNRVGYTYAAWGLNTSEVISHSTSGPIHFWNVASGKVYRTIGEPGPTTYRPSTQLVVQHGKNMALASDGNPLRVWDAVSGKLRHTLEISDRRVAISSDGQWIASAGADETLRIWNLKTGQLLPRSPQRREGAGAVNWLEISPTADRVAIASQDSGILSSWDLPTGDPLPDVPTPHAGITAFSWSPDGRRLAIAGYGSGAAIALFDGRTGRPLGTIQGGPKRSIEGVAWSPQKSRLAVGSTHFLGNKWVHGLSMWDLDSAQQRNCAFQQDWPYAEIEWSADGRWLVGDYLNVLNHDECTNALLPVSDQLFYRHATSSRRAWSPDGAHLAVALRRKSDRLYVVQLRKMPGGEVVREFGSYKELGGLDFSPQGDRIAFVWGDETQENPSTLTICKVATGEEIGSRQTGETETAGKTVAWSPDGRMICVDSIWRFRIFDGQTAEAIATYAHDMGTAASFYAANWIDERHFAGASNGLVKIWDVHSNEAAKQVLQHEAASALVTLSVSPDKRYLAVWRLPAARHVTIWDWQAERKAATLALTTPDADLPVIISPQGHFHAPEGAQSSLVAVVQTEQGQSWMPLEEFSQRYGWKNDPNQVWSALTAVSPPQGVPLPAAEQAEDVRKELGQRNPKFQGQFDYVLENNKVVTWTIAGGRVEDLSPLLALTDLKRLDYDSVEPERDAPVLREMTSLVTINNRSAASFRLSFPPNKPKPGVDEDWVKSVQNLPPKKQVEAVLQKLKEQNPGYDGAHFAPITESQVTTLHIKNCNAVTDISPLRALPHLTCLLLLPSSNQDTGRYERNWLSDLSPLAGMKLTSLACDASAVSDLSPLAGMKLTTLILRETEVSDLTPLAGMPLTVLDCWKTNISDLAPLAEMPLTRLELDYTAVSDLSPLKGMPLTVLNFGATRVSDLSPLKGMKLTRLCCNGTPVADLSPLAGLPLTELYCHSTKITDLSPLAEAPLKELAFYFHSGDASAKDVKMIRGMATLETINDQPAAEYWKKYDEAHPVDRRVAQWVLDVGGTVVVRLLSGEEITCGAANSLPADSFVVTAITLAGEARVQDDDLAKLAELKNLTRLTLLSVRHLTNDCAAHLARIDCLKEMFLFGLPLTSDGFQEIARLPHLQTLRITDIRVTVEDMAAIARLPALTELFLKVELDGDCLKALRQSPHLVVLNLEQPQISEEGWQSLLTLENLRMLCFTVTSDISPQRLRQLRRLRRLGCLYIWNYPDRLRPDRPTTEQLQAIANIDQLGELWLQNVVLSPEGLAVLQTRPWSKLILDHCQLDGIDLASLKFSGLKTLDFRGISLTAEQIAALRKAMPETELLYDEPPPATSPFDAKQARAHQEAWAKHLGTAVEATNSVGAKMILIPPGVFLMGSSDEQAKAAEKAAVENKNYGVLSRIPAELPQHRVAITKPFFLSATEVTIGQFKKFSATGYRTEAERAKANAEVSPDANPSGTPKPLGTYLDPGYPVTDDSPAAHISWNDAVAYCQWLSQQEGATYRLPTEAEWEYACRAGATTHYFCGDDVALLDRYAWHNCLSNEPRPVGAKLPNHFGLFDMHGNLSEWCRDVYDEKWYAASPATDPTGPVAGSDRAIRGSHWVMGHPGCRGAARNHGAPTSHNYNTGFRYVRVLDAPETTTSVSPASDAAKGEQARNGNR